MFIATLDSSRESFASFLSTMEDSEEPRKAEPEPPATEQKDKADAKVTPATEDKPVDSKSDKKRAIGKETTDKKEKEQKSEEQGLSRSKRSRKSADAFAPEDFKHVDRSIDVASGRGQRLGDLEAVCESVNSYASTSEDMLLAHKLLFTTRGKPPRREMKANILNFSGYLKKKKEGQDEKESDKEDEEAEVRTEDDISSRRVVRSSLKNLANTIKTCFDTALLLYRIHL